MSDAFQRGWAIVKMPYHGTSKRRAKLIMQQGLRGQFGHPLFPTKRVSFGAKNLDLAREYAEIKAGEQGAVIHIADDVPTLMNEPNAQAVVYEGTIPPEKLRMVKDE